ncbi:MAG: sulfite exporter TauE/SafE family protein, partial [Dehalococcoidia bacterium]
MHVDALEFTVAAAAVLFGSVVQGSIGVGLNIISAPVVAIVVPEALPATLVLVALPIALTTLRREQHALDRVALPWLLAGALPGTAIGLVIVDVASARELAIIVGSTVLTGVILSITSPPVPTNRATALIAGFTSNLFGTASAVGGPPVALLFQHRTGPIARATLGAFFLTSASLSIIGYL